MSVAEEELGAGLFYRSLAVSALRHGCDLLFASTINRSGKRLCLNQVDSREEPRA
jgi:hypothetical protein